jgi:fructose-bisphosphate aldolase class I
MNTEQLQETAQAMVAPGKGILAADESAPTIEKRLKSIGVESTEENRRSYRQLLLTTPGLADHISGVILFDETLRQSTTDRIPFVDLLTKQGILPGIKVDTGARDLAGSPGEKVTEGLEGLPERLAEYRKLGARFAKWRGVIAIGKDLPTDDCVGANAKALAQYAILCQDEGLVPIVEPEVLMDGDHDIHMCEEVTSGVLQETFDQLVEHGVLLEGVILKPNMVLPGTECTTRATVAEIATITLECFRKTVPSAVPGICFLSGGQSPEEATTNLNAMNTMGRQPWELSFSYGRALQAPVLKAWGGSPENANAAQLALAVRARYNGAARDGTYSVGMDQPN